MRSHLKYRGRLLRRAVCDTKAHIGWNLKTFATSALFLVVFPIFWRIEGRSAAMDQVIHWLYFGVGPMVGFVVLLFLYNLFRAPGKLHREQQQQIDELQERADHFSQDQVDPTGLIVVTMCQVFVDELYNEPPSPSIDLDIHCVYSGIHELIAKRATGRIEIDRQEIPYEVRIDDRWHTLPRARRSIIRLRTHVPLDVAKSTIQHVGKTFESIPFQLDCVRIVFVSPTIESGDSEFAWKPAGELHVQTNSRPWRWWPDRPAT